MGDYFHRCINTHILGSEHLRQQDNIRWDSLTIKCSIFMVMEEQLSGSLICSNNRGACWHWAVRLRIHRQFGSIPLLNITRLPFELWWGWWMTFYPQSLITMGTWSWLCDVCQCLFCLSSSFSSTITSDRGALAQQSVSLVEVNVENVIFVYNIQTLIFITMHWPLFTLCRYAAGMWRPGERTLRPHHYCCICWPGKTWSSLEFLSLMI